MANQKGFPFPGAAKETHAMIVHSICIKKTHRSQIKALSTLTKMGKTSVCSKEIRDGLEISAQCCWLGHNREINLQ